MDGKTIARSELYFLNESTFVGSRAVYSSDSRPMVWTDQPVPLGAEPFRWELKLRADQSSALRDRNSHRYWGGEITVPLLLIQAGQDSSIW